ncbi:hypothetical protein M569_05016, partial [Genlisea aurea]
MLKVIAFRCSSMSSFGGTLRGVGGITRGPELPFFRALQRTNSKKRSYVFQRFFCSDSSDVPDRTVAAGVEAKDAEAGDEAAESNSSSAIVPTVVRPEDCLSVIALPLPHRPLFPGFYMPIFVKDSKLLAALVDSRKRQAPYTGAFLIKDEEGADGSESDRNIYDLKGKDLFNRLHEVGTLAQITSIQGDQVVLIGHRRLRITEMV